MKFVAVTTILFYSVTLFQNLIKAPETKLPVAEKIMYVLFLGLPILCGALALKV